MVKIMNYNPSAEEAIIRGCYAVYVDTMSWQAPDVR